MSYNKYTALVHLCKGSKQKDPIVLVWVCSKCGCDQNKLLEDFGYSSINECETLLKNFADYHAKNQNPATGTDYDCLPPIALRSCYSYCGMLSLFARNIHIYRAMVLWGPSVCKDCNEKGKKTNVVRNLFK